MFRLAALLALLLAPAAVAQQPPDERVAAAAMADATVRFSDAADALEDGESGDTCTRALRGLPRGKADEASFILAREYLRELAERLAGDLARLRTDLANAQTRDPVLLSGRAAWRQLARAFEALPPARDPCAVVRKWRRAGAPHAEALRARREVIRVISAGGKEFSRKTEAAADRLEELGVPEERAETFSGD